MENKKPNAIDPEEKKILAELDNEQLHTEEENFNANQRDSGPDDFDDDTDMAEDDRIRGAGRQSMEELAIENEDDSWGLAEGVGGLRADRPEENANEEDRPRSA